MPFKVIQGHWFWHQSKARICNFLLVVNSDLGPILPRFRYIAGFLRRATTPLFHPNFRGVLFGLDCNVSEKGQDRIKVTTKITDLGWPWTAITHCTLFQNICDFGDQHENLETSEKIASENAKNCLLSTILLSFVVPSPENLREYSHKSYTATARN